jgi:hypothetical protein
MATEEEYREAIGLERLQSAAAFAMQLPELPANCTQLTLIFSFDDGCELRAEMELKSTALTDNK